MREIINPKSSLYRRYFYYITYTFSDQKSSVFNINIRMYILSNVIILPLANIDADSVGQYQS